MADSRRGRYRPKLTALEVQEEIANDPDSGDEDFDEGSTSFEDEDDEHSDIFHRLIVEGQQQDLDPEQVNLDVDPNLNLDLADVYSDPEHSGDEFRATTSSRSRSRSLIENASVRRGRGHSSRARARRGRGRGRGRGGTSQHAMIEQWDSANADDVNTVEFRGTPGLSVDTSNFRPVDFLEVFFNGEFLQHLVTQTNLYASQHFIENPNTPRFSRAREWTETNVSEMKKFLGIVLLMGLVKMPTIQHYWSLKILYRHPVFSTVMPRNRFQLLLKFLHFHDNTNMPQRGDANYDRLYKLRPVLDHLHNKFQEFYTPRKEICVDESLILWKGRLIFRQYLPLKRARFGIKMFLCCESDVNVKGSGGYCFRFRIYSAKDDPSNEIRHIIPDDTHHLSMSEQMVVYLIQPLLNKGYTVYMDNWYSSLRLYLYLLQQQTLACGTVRVDRGIPLQLREAVPAQGSSSTTLCGDSKIVATKFVSTKNVHFLSTQHGHQEDEVQNRWRTGTIVKPRVAIQYNRNMGGVDKQDQLIKPYDCTRKTMKWTKKLFFHLLQISACNSFICAKKTGYSQTLLDFLESVIVSWLWQEEPTPQTSKTDDDVRLDR